MKTRRDYPRTVYTRTCDICNSVFTTRRKNNFNCSTKCGRAAIAIPVELRFWEKVDIRSDDECWPWLAGVSKGGYGAFQDGTRLVKAHRMAYALRFGALPEWDGHAKGVCVCHRCDVSLCCNPSHLFLGTSADNNTDRHNKGRDAVQMVGVLATNVKLSDDDIRAIRKDTRTQKVLGAIYSVHPNWIGLIRLRKVWGHVKD